MFMPRWAFLLLGCFLSSLISTSCNAARSRVVLYCAQDQEFAELVFDDFQKQTALTIAPHYDTESTKSVSLYKELVQEADRPRCDVHWNNEIIGTILLQRQGLLEPYESPSAKPYPESARAADHSWHAFAARARVLIVNTKLVPEDKRPKSIFDLAKPEWKGKIAMAKPAYGTTGTQAACLFEVLGPEKAREYYRSLKANNIQIAAGNKHVAEGVGKGEFAMGITDTDDAIAEVKAGHPVAIIFPDRAGSPDNPRMGTLFIPNTVAIIRGCPNPHGARKLIDFLLGAEVERKLAESASHQIPLNPSVQADLPKEIERPGAVKAMEVNFNKAADLSGEVEKFLVSEFGRP